jgi:carbon-monoxide dehydrogenase small subunit
MSDTVPIRVTINGEARSAAIDPRRLLVEAIRDDFGLKGTHIGCLTGDCGACTCDVDGRITKTCLVLAVQADGAEITTIEGFANPPAGSPAGDELHPIQQALWDGYGFQCGYCLPGMLFAARDLLERNPSPTEADVRHALNGNLCRCTGYDRLVVSVIDAAGRMANA